MGATWTTADYALIVSLCSASLSLLSLGWNIWSKFIFPKAKVRLNLGLSVNFPVDGIAITIGDEARLPDELVDRQMNYPAGGLVVRNFGPHTIQITDVFGQSGSFPFSRVKQSRFSLYRYYPPHEDDQDRKWLKYGAISEKLEIATGGTATLFFPVTPSMFKRLNMNRIAVADGFGRSHFVNASDMRKFRRQVAQFVSDPDT